MPTPKPRNTPPRNRSRQLHVGETFFRRPRARGFPPEPQAVISALVKGRSRGLRGKGEDRYLTGTNIAELRGIPAERRSSSEYAGGLKLARESIAGKLALASWDDLVLLDFLKSRKYVFVDSRGSLVGSNVKPWIGRRRIATEDILWLRAHL